MTNIYEKLGGFTSDTESGEIMSETEKKYFSHRFNERNNMNKRRIIKRSGGLLGKVAAVAACAALMGSIAYAADIGGIRSSLKGFSGFSIGTSQPYQAAEAENADELPYVLTLEEICVDENGFGAAVISFAEKDGITPPENFFDGCMVYVNGEDVSCAGGEFTYSDNRITKLNLIFKGCDDIKTLSFKASGFEYKFNDIHVTQAGSMKWSDGGVILTSLGMTFDIDSELDKICSGYCESDYMGPYHFATVEYNDGTEEKLSICCYGGSESIGLFGKNRAMIQFSPYCESITSDNADYSSTIYAIDLERLVSISFGDYVLNAADAS